MSILDYRTYKDVNVNFRFNSSSIVGMVTFIVCSYVQVHLACTIREMF